MSDERYRDDLAAAHRRIAQLEDEARGVIRYVPRGKTPAFAVVIGVVAISLLGTFIVAVAVSLFRTRPPVISTSYEPPEPPLYKPPPPRLYASWYTQHDVLPTLVDVDGDGTSDVVGLFWRSGADAKPLYVAAIDGKTFTLKWSAGPYPSQWASTRTHLAVVKDMIVVTESQEDLIVLRARDGSEVRRSKVPGGLTELCAMSDGSSRALLRLGMSTPPDPATQVLDLESGWTRGAGEGASCARRYPSCSNVGNGRPCFAWGALPSVPRHPTLTSARRTQRTLQEADRAVEILTPSPGESGREAPHGVGFVKGAKKALWEKSLVLPGDELHFGDVQTEMRDRKLAVFYQTKAGPFRVVVYDAATGDMVWSALVKDTQEGSYAAAFGLEDDRVIAVVNHTVHLYDATSGEYLKGIDAGSI